jgi:lipopolysaccharide export system permease protein
MGKNQNCCPQFQNRVQPIIILSPWAPMMLLHRYILGQFARSLLTMLALMAIIIFLLDYLEQARRFSERGLDLSVLLKIIWLRMPRLLGQTLPFILLFAAILASHRLNRGRELLIARLSGLSLFHLMAGLVIATGLLGVTKILLLDPLANYSFGRYERLEGRLLNRPINVSGLGENGLWLSQSRFKPESTEIDGYDIMQVQQFQDRPLKLRQVMILQFDSQDRLLSRLNAAEAVPQEDRTWILVDVTQYDLANPDAPPVPVTISSMTYASALSGDSIRQRVESPERLTVWQLPRLIRTLEQTGFATRVHRLYWQSLLVYPVLLMTMLVIGITVGQHGGPRTQQQLWQAVVGATIAFGFYGLTQVFQALATGDRIPVMVGAWAPALMMLSASLAFLLHRGE